MTRCLFLLAIFMLAAARVFADVDAEAKTVLGPRNPDLHYGAEALISGDGEKGLRLTLRGLKFAQGKREEKTGHANLCAGYLIVGQPEAALPHCDWVLQRDDRHWRTYNNRALVYLRLERYEESEADIAKGQELNPNSEKLKEVKALYLDEVDPVIESILMDDRRKTPDESSRPRE